MSPDELVQGVEAGFENNGHGDLQIFLEDLRDLQRRWKNEDHVDGGRVCGIVCCGGNESKRA